MTELVVMGKPKYCGQEVSNSRDVDTVTAALIHQVVGDFNEQIKCLREGLVALNCLMFPKDHGGTKTKWAQERGDYLLQQNRKIEDIVAIGKDFKRSQGWDG